MASTEPESDSEVSAAAETSEEGTETAPEPAGGTEKDSAGGAVRSAAKPPVTESGSGAPRRVTSSAIGGAIGAEIPAASQAGSPATATESAAPGVTPAGGPETESEPGPVGKGEAGSGAESGTKPAEQTTAEQPAAAEQATAEQPAGESAEGAASQADLSGPATTAPRKRPALVAALAGLTRTRTSSATAAAVGDSAGNGPEGSGVDGGGPGAPGKVSRPMVAAAAIGGVVLLSLPFVVASATGDGGPKHNTRNTAAGYADPGQGADGYVPGADATKGAAAPGGSKHSGSKNGAGAPPITEAASADSASGPGEKPVDGKEDGKKGGGKDTASDESQDGKKSGSSSGDSDGGGKGSGSTTQRTAANSATLFSAVGGPHCSSSSVTYAERGAYSDDQEGWTTHDGAYASGGCTGRYRSMPMSGSSSKDSGNSVIWVFRTGKVTSGSCEVSVYIPDDSVARHVGGQPSYYTVHNGTDGNATQLGRFTITQVSHRGQWVGASTYKITGGLLTVKLHDRGDDWSSSSRDNAHHAVSAVRVECKA
ncbi:hypothetical protein OG285_11315 [Streptomyces sp. NBC_01471]|uniref:hypothetical protein n=1 Tax=Streptomyces sp. NBC_01471 TaxID=2903879 RepID=UPI003248F79C